MSCNALSQPPFVGIVSEPQGWNTKQLFTSSFHWKHEPKLIHMFKHSCCNIDTSIMEKLIRYRYQVLTCSLGSNNLGHLVQGCSERVSHIVVCMCCEAFIQLTEPRPLFWAQCKNHGREIKCHNKCIVGISEKLIVVVTFIMRIDGLAHK